MFDIFTYSFYIHLTKIFTFPEKILKNNWKYIPIEEKKNQRFFIYYEIFYLFLDKFGALLYPCLLPSFYCISQNIPLFKIPKSIPSFKLKQTARKLKFRHTVCPSGRI